MAKMIAMILFAAAASSVKAEDPIQMVLQMLSNLEAKIIGEGNDAQKVYDEFAEFCEDRSRNVGFEIKSGQAQKKDLEATIADEVAKSESLNAKIDELSAAISTDEQDLQSATEIRGKEQSSFEAEEKELVEVIDTLARAIHILESEMAKTGSASLVQLQSAQSVTEALAVMVQATSLSSQDASKLTALLQSQDSSDDVGAPAGAVFKGQSGGIIQTLQDLYDKAEGQLADARNTEKKNVQAFQLLEQSLKDEIKFGNADMSKAKKNLGASQEAKATAEGDLAVTTSDLDEDTNTLATLHHDCMSGAENFEAETKSRGEELKALATAKKVIQETTSGAQDLSYSFLQTGITSGADLAKFEALRLVRDLAQREKSAALVELASRMAAAMHSGAGDDIFGKVKGLIRDMIEKLLKEAEADATEKAFCDKELAETNQKKADKEEAIEKLSTQIDSMSANSARLKGEVATLQKELADLARAQAEMDKLRAEEKAAFEANSAEMKKGIEGIKMALKVLREYYAKEGKSHASADGAGSGIIGLLEVCESDFTKGLAEMTATENSQANDYDRQTKENQITKATKDQDEKYKTKEFKGLDKDIADATSDRSTVQAELDAVNDYLKGIEARCIAKAETYSERVRRRDAEIAGLKEALSILNGEAVLLQRRSKHALRGVHPHRA